MEKKSKNIDQLYKRLVDANDPDHRYYLPGLLGSKDENDKLELTIYRNGDKVFYEIYFKERGISSTINVFSTETEACECMFEKLIYERDLFNVLKIVGINGMTINERLFAAELIEEFDVAIIHDKRRAREILTLVGVDQSSIYKIID